MVHNMHSFKEKDEEEERRRKGQTCNYLVKLVSMKPKETKIENVQMTNLVD